MALNGRPRRMRTIGAIVALALAGTAGTAIARFGRWVPAWGAAQMRGDGPDAARITAAGPATVRQIVHLSAGGRLSPAVQRGR